jgi:uncharacterized membrane protein YkoI
MFKKLLVTGCTLLLLAACGTDTPEENAGTANQVSPASENNASNNTNNETTAANDSSNENTPNTTNQFDIINPTVSMDEAVKVFQEAHPDAKVESIDFDTDSGRLHYDFDGFDTSKEYEMEIDASTKEIKESEVETDSDKDEFLDFATIIDLAKAIEIASSKAEVEGHSPTGWELEADDKKQTYTIEFEKNDSDIDIKLDATNGEILEIED